MTRTVLVAGLTALAVAMPASANLLTNGSFEDGTNGWTTATFWSPGWGTPAPPLESKTSLGTFGGFGGPQDGSHYLAGDVSGHANYHVGAYQTFATVPGQIYTVSGWYAGGVEASNDTGWWEVKIAHGTTSDPDADGVVIAKQERSNGQYFDFAENFSNTFTAQDTTTTLFLKWGRAESADWKISGAAFDNLSVVPEPATLALLALGLPMLRRRKVNA